MYFKRHKGFSLPMAIFILVIMALLAAAAVSILGKGQAGISQEIMSTRAFYAAESGAQSVLNQLFPLNGAAANCSAGSSVNFNSTGLNSCNANMTCTATTIGSETFYIVNSTGTCSTGSITTVRDIQIMARG